MNILILEYILEQLIQQCNVEQRGKEQGREEWLTYSIDEMASGLPNRLQRTEKSRKQQGFLSVPSSLSLFPPLLAPGVRKAKIYGMAHQSKIPDVNSREL